MQLHRVGNELEYVLWERKNLEKQLHMAIKECRMMDVMLTELENEHEYAIVRIELLGQEVRDLKDEIRKIKEVEGKSLWNEAEINQNHDINELMNTQSKIRWPIEQRAADTISEYNTVCAKQRDLALSQSLFSALLALLVGTIVWETEDPCMPLILALGVVVAMSLWSVVKFFGTIQHKPTPDAVALLSFNWFMIGILMYPTLPMFARVTSPLALRFLGRNV